MTIRRTLHTLALSTALFTVSLGSALAQDATAVADQLKTALAAQNVELGWSAVTGDASSMVIEGATIKPVGEANSLPIGNVTLTNVTEDAGAIVIETLSTEPFSHSEDGISLDLSAFVISGMRVPPAGNTDPMAALMMYQSAELESMEVRVADKTAFSMNGLAVEITPPADGSPMEFTGAAEKFTGDLSLVEDPQSKMVIDALGYQNIAGFFEMAGSWNPTDGRMTLSQYDISVENAGTLGMTFDLGGYTVDFLKQIQDMQKKMAENPGADNSAQGLAMLGLMQQLTFHGASVRFDDDSLTNKVIDYVAKMQNMSADDIKNQAKAVVPFMTAQLNNPELSQQVTAAVTAFLDGPENLEVAAAPATPVPFAQVMAAGMSNPMELTRTLGVKVTANQQ